MSSMSSIDIQSPIEPWVEPSVEPLVKPLLGASLAELTEWVQQQQQPTYRAQQLHQWIYQRGVDRKSVV